MAQLDRRIAELRSTYGRLFFPALLQLQVPLAVGAGSCGLIQSLLPAVTLLFVPVVFFPRSCPFCRPSLTLLRPSPPTRPGPTRQATLASL